MPLLLLLFFILSGALSLDADVSVLAPASLAMPLENSLNSARGAAMGSAFVAIANDSAALFWNPAGLGMVDSMELGFHHNSWLTGILQETAIFNIPAEEFGGFGLALSYVNYGSFEGRDDNGLLSDSYSANMVFLDLGWGNELMPGLYGGAAVKGTNQNLANIQYGDVSADVGVIWKGIKRLSLGATVSNLSPGVNGYAKSASVDLGAAYNLFLGKKNPPLLLALSTQLVPGGVNKMHGGVEYVVMRIMALRGGFQNSLTDNQIEGISGLTFGFGIIYKNFNIDYAYQTFGYLGNPQMVSVSCSF